VICFFIFSGGVAEEPVEFTIDAGSETADITANVEGPNNTRQNCDVTHVGNGKYKVRFTPRGSGSHSVEVSVNGKKLPGDPIQIPVEEKEEEIAYEYDKGITMNFCPSVSNFHGLEILRLREIRLYSFIIFLVIKGVYPHKRGIPVFL